MEIHTRLNEMANYLYSLNVSNLNWTVSTHTAANHADIQRAIDRMREPDEAPDEGINQIPMLQYSRLGSSMLHLARIPGNFRDEARLDPSGLPVSIELTTNGGPEILMGRNECQITTYYPLPPELRSPSQ